MKVILLSLNNFSSWWTVLCCIFNGWQAEKSTSTLPKLEKAGSTVVHSKKSNPVYTEEAYWYRIFICILKCWIYCYITLYILQNGSGIFWVSPHSSDSPLLVFLFSSVPSCCLPSHCVPLQQPLLWGLAFIFLSWCFSYPIFAFHNFGSNTTILQYISCLGLIRNLNITTLICCCSVDALLAAIKMGNFL